MDLSREDSLRINVLLANKPQAIKINESSMTVHGLMPSGEVQVKLNPDCRDEKYIKRVKEVLSSHVTGSPGGYPVFLQRWTRMGQMRDTSLEQLLLLGEPEAVVACVCATGVTDEIARRAWWAMEDSENARRLLQHEAVVNGEMGAVLAAYLIDHLPFETEPEKMIESVQRVLQPGLIDQAAKDDLWKKGARKSAYHVGFILSVPDEIPLAAKKHRLSDDYLSQLSAMADAGNLIAAVVAQMLSESGQAFFKAFDNILKKPSNQEVVNLAFDAMRLHLQALRPEGDPDMTMQELEKEARQWLSDGSDEKQAILALHEDLENLLIALRTLSGLGYGALRPVFHDTTAIGSLMRRKLEPVFTPLIEHLQVLQES